MIPSVDNRPAANRYPNTVTSAQINRAAQQSHYGPIDPVRAIQPAQGPVDRFQLSAQGRAYLEAHRANRAAMREKQNNGASASTPAESGARETTDRLSLSGTQHTGSAGRPAELRLTFMGRTLYAGNSQSGVWRTTLTAFQKKGIEIYKNFANALNPPSTESFETVFAGRAGSAGHTLTATV